MNIGKMRTRATVRAYQSGGRDPVTGYPLDPAWVDTNQTLWGNLLFISGKEIVAAGAEWAVNEASFRTRFTTDIDTTQRLVIDGLEFEITGVLPDLNDRKHTDILIKKGLTQ